MAGRRKGGGEDAEDHGAGMERWLLTYSDMITLLLALFVILFALSTINTKKFVAFKEGIVHAFSHKVSVQHASDGLLQQTSLVNHPAATNSTNGAVAASASPPTTQPVQPLDQVEAAVRAALQSAGLASQAQMSMQTRGLVVQVLSDPSFYSVDSAALSATGDRVVDTIASVLKPEPEDIAVEGYTDNQPIYGGPYSNNWELSAARAVNVVTRMISDGIAAGRLSAVGYGDTRPAVPNDTPAHQAENRRVDVVVLAPGSTRE